LSASRMARASSVPGSVSMMIFLGCVWHKPDVAVSSSTSSTRLRAIFMSSPESEISLCHPERARPSLREGSTSREPALSLPKGTLRFAQ
jgi:hypothetical protein